MAEDISRKTILVLVVLTLAVSFIGTYAVLQELDTVKVVDTQEQSATGQVRLSVIEPQPTVDRAGGTISLEVVNPPQES